MILLFIFLFNNNLYASSAIEDKFTAIQKIYFPKLNLRVPVSDLKKLPKFTDKLDALAFEVSKQKHFNSKNEKATAGLILIYDAMFNMNIVIGITENKLILADYIKYRSYANPHVSENEELQARLQYVITELREALELRPDDHRIDSWIAANKMQAQKIKTGKISQRSKTALLNSISARPSFNLWTAILGLHNQPPESNQALLAAAKNFVDAADQGKDPCTLHPSDCISSWKAPFNFQASVTELGDVFFQQAEYYLAKGDVKKAMMLTGYAAGTYKQLFKPKRVKLTEQWPDYSALTIRKKQLKDLQKQIVPKENLSWLYPT